MGSNVLYYKLCTSSKIEREETYCVSGNSNTSKPMNKQNMKKKNQKNQKSSKPRYTLFFTLNYLEITWTSHLNLQVKSLELKDGKNVGNN
jgi:hypothetical protein